jgi:hypothetical protein
MVRYNGILVVAVRLLMLKRRARIHAKLKEIYLKIRRIHVISEVQCMTL